MRKQFEAWAKEHHFAVSKDEKVISDGLPIYSNPMTHGAWMAWSQSAKVEMERIIKAFYEIDTQTPTVMVAAFDMEVFIRGLP